MVESLSELRGLCVDMTNEVEREFFNLRKLKKKYFWFKICENQMKLNSLTLNLYIIKRLKNLKLGPGFYLGKDLFFEEIKIFLRKHEEFKNA